MSAGVEIQASWAGIKFWATSISGNANRRVAVYEGVYRDGATTEDLGRGPRRETLRIKLTAAEYVELEKAINAKKVRLFTHPLWGSFNARVVAPNYSFGTKSRGEIDIEIIEEKAQPLTPPESADKQSKKAEALYSDTQTAIENLDAPTEEITDANTTLTENWSDLSLQVAQAQEGLADWAEVDRSLKTFQEQADTCIDLIRSQTDETDSWEAIDTLIRTKDYMTQFVELTKAEDVYRSTVKITNATDVYTLCAYLFGDYTRVDDILDVNDILDPFFIEVGTELLIPPSTTTEYA